MVRRGRDLRALEQQSRSARRSCASRRRRRRGPRASRRRWTSASSLSRVGSRGHHVSSADSSRSKPVMIVVGDVELELRDDVAPHVRRGRRRERDGRRRAELLADLGDAQIARPEVVPPLADAVRLVDGEQRHAGVAQPLGGRAGVEPLRRDVEQLDVAAHARARADRRSVMTTSVLLTNVAGSPRAASASTWSFISEISGEMTTVSLGASAPAPGSRATCRRRWGGRRACRARRAPTRRRALAPAETPDSRSARWSAARAVLERRATARTAQARRARRSG